MNRRTLAVSLAARLELLPCTPEVGSSVVSMATSLSPESGAVKKRSAR